MNKEWLKDHVGHLVGGGSAGAGGAAVFLVMFRDAIKEWWQERREERRAARAEHAGRAGRGDHAMAELIQLLKDDIHAQRANERETILLLGQMATSHERSLDLDRTMSNQIKDVYDRLTKIEGTLRMQ